MRKHKLTKKLLKQYPNFTEAEYNARREALAHYRTEKEVENILQKVFNNHNLHPDSSSLHPFDYVWGSWEKLKNGFIYRGRFDTTEGRNQFVEIGLEDKTVCVYFQDTSHWRESQNTIELPVSRETAVFSTYFTHFTQTKQ